MLSQDELKITLQLYGVELSDFRIANGGSATIHRGRLLEQRADIRAKAGSKLAIKEYKDEIASKSEQIERIRQEVLVGKAVNHTNVVAIHALINRESAAPLLLMDWVDGEPLDNWCKSAERDWLDIQKVALGLVDGLAALHAGNIMHRDIKPANIMIGPTGVPVIMDMGVVEVASNDEHTLHTSLGDFIGSVRYSAPQFIRGDGYQFSDDVYALAATLFLVVTGKEVFHDVDRKPLLPYYILTTHPKVGEVPTRIPPQIAVLLEGALHPDRKRRPSLAEFRAFVEDPNSAPYSQRELDARNRETRGYQIISVQDDGATVFADMRGALPEVSGQYIAVRELSPLTVPSLAAKAKPEKWIADVELKHMTNDVGHFVVKGKRWKAGKPSFASGIEQFMGTPGEWVEYDRVSDRVKVGDIIVAIR